MRQAGLAIPLSSLLLTASVVFLGCSAKPFTDASMEVIQQARVESGLSKLEYDASLQAITNKRIDYIAETLDFRHDVDFFYSNIRYDGYACELLGKQPIKDPAYDDIAYDVIGKAWLASPIHSECIMREQHKRYGIAGAIGSDGWVYIVLWLID